MSRNSKIVIAVVAVIAVAAIAFFGIRNRMHKPTEDKNVIKIGAILPLTGSLANLGQENKAGIMLAVEDVNNKGNNYRIDVVFYDSKGDPKTALSAMRQLDILGVDKIILSTTQTVLPILQAYKNDARFMFSANCQTDGLLTNYNNAMRIYFSSENETTMMASYILKNEFKRIGILRINTESGLEPITVMRKKIQNKNPLAVFAEQVFEFSDKSYKDKILAIQAFNPEAIVVYSYPDQWPQLVKHLTECRVNCPIIANSGFGQTAENDYFKNMAIMRQIVFPAPKFVLDQSNIRLRNVSARLEKKFNMHVNYNILYLYDNILAYSYALNKAGWNASNASLLDSLNGLSFQGITGNVSFDSKHDIQLGELKMVKILNGKYIPLD